VSRQDVGKRLVRENAAPRIGVPVAAEQIRGLVPVEAGAKIFGEIELGRIAAVVVVEAENRVS
jgi:hypothetical protein